MSLVSGLVVQLDNVPGIFGGITSSNSDNRLLEEITVAPVFGFPTGLTTFISMIQ